MINVDDLKKCGNNFYEDGYRIVLFYEDRYQIGSWASDIKNFMYDFASVAPIENDDDVPRFISIEDILNRWIERDKKLIRVAIYSVCGSLIREKCRE